MTICLGLFLASGIEYNLVPLTPHPGTRSFDVIDINDNGAILGTYRDPAAPASVKWNGVLYDRDGAITQVGNPDVNKSGYPMMLPAGLNNSNLVAGQIWSGVPAVWSGGAVSLIPRPVDSFSNVQATGINNMGAVVGFRKEPASPNSTHAWRYSNGVFEDIWSKLLPPNATGYSAASDINDSGAITGTLKIGLGATYSRAYVLSPDDSLSYAPYLVGYNTEGLRINNAGHLLYQLFLNESSTRFSLFWGGSGNPTIIESIFGDASQARDLNDMGVAVGKNYMSLGQEFGSRAFIWDSGHGTRDLTQLIDAQGWLVYDALGINNDGEIVGIAKDPAGNWPVSVLLTPLQTPEPPTALMVLIAAVCAAVSMWFKSR